MNARADILARIRAATTDLTPTPVERRYHPAGFHADSREVLTDLLVDRLLDYRALVRRCLPDAVTDTIAAALHDRGVQTVVVPTGFPYDVGPSAVADDPRLDLDALDGVVTTCAVAIAETGTIVLDAGPGQGRRALTLVPDYHLTLVTADQIVRSVPDAIAALTAAATRPQTWISGPSATSDIELNRVEGVHGPRTLEVIVVGAG